MKFFFLFIIILFGGTLFAMDRCFPKRCCVLTSSTRTSGDPDEHSARQRRCRDCGEYLIPGACCCCGAGCFGIGIAGAQWGIAMGLLAVLQAVGVVSVVGSCGLLTCNHCYNHHECCTVYRNGQHIQLDGHWRAQGAPSDILDV